MSYQSNNPNGQATSANSAPAVLASDQPAIPVTTIDITSTGTLTAVSQNVFLALNGQSAGSAQITGTWIGTITFEGYIDSLQTWVAINAVSASTSNPQTTTTTNGLYRLTPGGLTQFRANMSAFTSGSAVVTLKASNGVGGTFVNQIVPTKIDQTTPGSTNNVTISSGSTAIGTRADGFLRMQIDPTTLLFDTFETLDTTNTWTIGGTTSPTGISGTLSVSSGTSANATSYAKSIPVFTPAASSFLQYAALIQLESSVVTGNKRIWGVGTFVTPTLAAPITNGSVYEIDDITGALQGSVYSNSVRTQTVALTRPTDGLTHRYAIYYKASRVYFELDNVQVGSLAFPNPQVSALSTVIASINGTSVLGTAAVLTSSLIGVGDTGRNATKLADGTYPWRTGKISAQGAQLVGFDQTTPGTTNKVSLGTDVISINDADAFTSGTITAADAVVAAPSGNGTLVSGTSTAGSLVFLACPGGDSSWIIQVTGTFGGATVYWEGSIDSTNGTDGNWTNVNGRQTGVVNTVLSGSTTLAGFYRGNTSGITYLRVRAVGGSGISITCKLRISAGPGAIFLNASLPAGTNRMGSMQLTGGTTSAALGLGSTVTAYGNLRITAEPTNIFNDPFDGAVIDTTNRWNAAVVTGMTLSQSSGNLVIGTTTTNSNSAFIDTIPTFTSLGLNFLGFGAAVKLEAQSSNLFALNQHRFIGLGDRPASFVAATPLNNAIGFEIGTDGQLYCVVYSNGTNIFRSSTSLTGVNMNTLVTPSTGFVRYGMIIRADTIIFYINSTEYPVQSFSVSSVSFSLPNVQTLPVRFAAVNASAGTVGTSTFAVSTLGLGDTGANSMSISDGKYPWKKNTVNGNGQQLVQAELVDGSKTTYRAAVTALTVATTATDIFTITGSATKTVKIAKILITGVATTVAFINVLMIKRSTANSAGTSVAQTAVPADSNNAAATATVLSYTTNPTLGTTVGTIYSKKLGVSTPAGGANGIAAETEINETFGFGAVQAMVLRGTSQVLAINLNATSVAGSSFNITIEWTEE